MIMRAESDGDTELPRAHHDELILDERLRLDFRCCHEPANHSKLGAMRAQPFHRSRRRRQLDAYAHAGMRPREGLTTGGKR